ncbi:replication-associated recombination protein A [Accumulibacter sp.]|uniref:replication-associated recombination protein A n=1 Tax=Accumulibacter sp. TaxID=2053492 RepID=UPI00262F12E0|nr:replication-associated recombination protein A [Accumulibacter sp.]
MSDLFAVSHQDAPLAERLRPKALAEVIGQQHLLGPGKPLAMAFQSGQLHSMILWGPPGVGKTTLARLMADAFDADFIALSAVFAGVRDIREAVAGAEATRARSGRRTILFVDEVHRFNKAQQDAFLPYVEGGLLTLVGATTENPSFEVNSALLSRASVYVLQPLSVDDLGVLFERACRQALPGLSFDDLARARVVGLADGDARRLLNLLEQIGTAAASAGATAIDGAFVDTTLAQTLRRFDKGGDAFYDQISALHKAVRGSSPDAALYWFCRMVDGGADARYLARRLVRMAWEDVGLADPRAVRIALDASETFERLGAPEGELALAQAVLYLAMAAKSNAGYLAYNVARRFIASDASRPVPAHLRNAPTRLMKNLGYGKDYRYAHDQAEAYAAGENYFPEGMPAVEWYRPVDRGLEIRIGEKLAHLRTLDRRARGEEKE